LRYAKSRLEQEKRDFAYRIFITDCIGHLVGLKMRWEDMVTEAPEETRTADEVISSISEKLAKIGGE